MTVSIARPDLPRRVWLYPLGALLGGCAVSGHAPLWMIALWTLTLGWWCQQDQRRRLVYSLPILLALLPAWPLHTDGFAFTGTYLQVTLSGIAVALFLNNLERGSGIFGVLALLLGFVLAPTPLGVFGLLGALLLRAQTQQRGSRQLTSPRAVGLLAALIVAVALLSALLPRPAVLSLHHAPAPRTAQATHTTPPTFGGSGLRKVSPIAPVTNSAASGAQPLGERVLTAIFPFFLVVALVFLLVALTMLITWRTRGSGTPWRIEEVLLAAAIGVAGAMLLLWAYLQNTLGAQLGGGSSGPTAAGSSALGHVGAMSQARATQVANVFGWLVVGAITLFALLLIAAVVLMILTRDRAQARAQEQAAAETASTPDASAENRVRRAYREMLALLSNVGLLRGSAETPHEFLARLGIDHPGLAPAATQLTDLYEPVRYGGQTDEAGAQQAEAALETLRHNLNSHSGPSNQGAI